MKKCNTSLTKKVQVPQMAPGADSPARSDATHSSGIRGWNLLWDMSLAPCVWLRATERRAVPPGSAEGWITHQATNYLH